MDIIIGGRGSGRTTELIKACAADPGSIIVCSTEIMASYIANTAKQMDLDIPKPISFNDLTNGHMRGRKITGCYFDNLEAILQTMVTKGIPVRYVSVEGGLENIIWLDPKQN